jgi:UDP-N-acetylglucosamine diphosphorylase/glucosamine-1-phosphate N-acetyltransferase
MQVIIFEDEKTLRFKPLVNLKPVFGLYTGCFSLQQKFEHAAAGNVALSYHLRNYLAPWFIEQHPGITVNTIVEDDLLLVNGRLLCDRAVIDVILEKAVEPGQAMIQNGSLLFCRTSPESIVRNAGMFPDLIDGNKLAGSVLVRETSGFRLLENIWDVIALHPYELRRDAASLELGRHEGVIHSSAVLVNPSNIVIGKGAVVKAGAVLDASDGFIHVGADAVVEPLAVLMQQVYLASGVRVKAGAKIYSNVVIGRFSKVGGEIEDSVIEPYANKQHDGYLGHSYISSWCNLGAGTNTSDLKNNYSKVRLVIDGQQLQTDLQFMGLLMADHAKCSINSMFSTGTVVGTAANIFGSGMPPKYVPSFSWGNGLSGFELYQIEKAVDTARKVMERRQIDMSIAYDRMFRLVAQLETARKVFV